MGTALLDHDARPLDGRPGDRLDGQPDGQPDDAELLVRMRAGDDEALAALYRRHAPAAQRYARRIAPRHADDVVSEALTSTLSAIRNGYGPRDGVRAYLFTAMRRHAARSRRAWEVPGDELEVAEAVDFDVNLAGDQPALRAVASLPPRWREVIVLVEVEGLPVQEVADRIGLNPAATSALLYRARAGLRAAYDDLVDADER